MKKFIKRIALFWLTLLSIGWCLVYADLPDTFSIEIEPSFNLWESVDFTVIAIKDGEWLKEYTWIVSFSLIDNNGNYLDSDYFTLPNSQFYDFIETDLWKKTFSKWLKVTKAWIYTLKVETLYPDWIEWNAVIYVAWDIWNGWTEPINISYPINWSTETKPYVSVMWSCENLKNSIVLIYLNDIIVNSGYTDIEWWFNVSAQELLSWDNTIQAKIVDVNGVVLWESPVISLKYKSQEDGVFSWIEILPWKEWKQWDKFIFNVYTNDSVNSAQLILSNGLKYSMDRIWQWLFSKEIEAIFTWTADISVSLTVNSDEKIYENADTISVREYVWVKNIKFTTTGVDWSQVVVSWETVWNISRYQITYWTGKNDLTKSTVVSSSSILIENLEKDTTYYFQIIPQDENSHTSWDPSDVVEYRPSALACVVKWIKVVTEKIWDNYYLVRDPVENAISYEVYRSDWADMTDARLVWSLTGTRFQYLYNPDATKDEYAFYQVQAICPDWKSVVVDKAQKVKVWPVENILLIIIISIFVYSLYLFKNKNFIL